MGVSVYGFYAARPYLLELYGSADSYAIAGLTAGLVAGAQIAGGLSAARIARLFRRRTSAPPLTAGISVLVLAGIGLVASFWLTFVLLAVWAVMFAAATPIRQAYLNGLIPSAQRATVLSSDNLLASGGGVVTQPALGRAADVWGYGPSYVIGAGVQLLALPFILLARRERAASTRGPRRGRARGRDGRGARRVGQPDSGRSSTRISVCWPVATNVHPALDAVHLEFADGEGAAGQQHRADRLEVIADGRCEQVDLVLDGEHRGALGEEVYAALPPALSAIALVAPAWK